MNPLRQLAEMQQSIWYDNIQRSMLSNGELKKMIDEDGLCGMTSNPAIFEKAIAGSHDYDEALKKLQADGKAGSSLEVFYHLAIEDIQMAADQFHATYQASNGLDGYVSLEVSPTLAHDTEGTIAEARELVKRVNRENLMIKVPATKAGLPAIETLISEGVNINATLLFSVDRYRELIDSYLRGLERLHANGGDVSKVASVASFFVSRVDSAVDKQLEAMINDSNRDEIGSVMGKAAIANAKAAYILYKDIYGSSRFVALRKAGAHPQRLLWASTGVKNPNYSDVMYVDQLIGPNTVNTVPPATYVAFRDHGTVADTLEQDEEGALHALTTLADLGINMTEVTDKLEADGVKLFADAFETLLGAIDTRLKA